MKQNGIILCALAIILFSLISIPAFLKFSIIALFAIAIIALAARTAPMLSPLFTRPPHEEVKTSENGQALA